jgi:hypothetical protein
MGRRGSSFAAIVVGVLGLVIAGCGYSLQHSRNPLFEAEGIRKVFVAPVANNTYKPGVENLVYNQLVKTVSANRKVRLAQRIEEADAVLRGSIQDASYVPSGTTTADKLFPSDRLPGLKGPSETIIATSYSASLTCAFSLENRHPRPGKPAQLWSSSFSRSKPFPGNNQLGAFGTTSALINESEFDRALGDIAQSMMGDLHESMLAQF